MILDEIYDEVCTQAGTETASTTPCGFETYRWSEAPGDCSSHGAICRNEPVGGRDYLGLILQVGNQTISRTSEFYNDHKDDYPTAKETMDVMIDSKSPYSYSNPDELLQELEYRHNVVKAMTLMRATGVGYIANESCHFETASHLWTSTFWDLGDEHELRWLRLKRSVATGEMPKKRAAIISLFANTTRIECLSATTLALWYGQVSTFTEEELEAKFLLKKTTAPLCLISGDPAKHWGLHGPLMKWLAVRMKPVSEADIVPGDMVNFPNMADYKEKHPGEFWTSVNTIYVGGGKYSALGMYERTADEIRGALAAEYAEGTDPNSLPAQVVKLRARP